MGKRRPTPAAVAVKHRAIQKIIDAQERPHLAEVLEGAPDLWKKLDAEAADYMAHRLREIHRLTGGVSAGVATLVRMEAEAFTDAAFLRVTALKLLDPHEQSFALVAAHRLNAAAARQAQAAWTLANAEHARRRGKMAAGPGPVKPKTLAAALEDHAAAAEREPESPAGEYSP